MGFILVRQVIDRYITHYRPGPESRGYCNVAKKVAVANKRNAKRQRSNGDINQPLSPTQAAAFYTCAFRILADSSRSPLEKRMVLDAMSSASIEQRAGGRVSNGIIMSTPATLLCPSDVDL